MSEQIQNISYSSSTLTANERNKVLKNAYKSNFTVAGGKTPEATTTNDLPMGDESPISNIKRPPKPATGANPRG